MKDSRNQKPRLQDIMSNQQYEDLNKQLQKTSEILRSFRPQLTGIEEVAKQFEQLNNAPIRESAKIIQYQMDQTMTPLLKVWEKQAEQWKSIYNRISRLQIATEIVPKTIHPFVNPVVESVEDWAESIDETWLEQGDSKKFTSTDRKITWDQILNWILTIITFYGVVSDYQTGQQIEQTQQEIEQNRCEIHELQQDLKESQRKEQIILQQVEALREEVEKHLAESEAKEGK